MALGIAKVGRPYPVATIPLSNDRKVGLLEEFWGACADFRYREEMAVSRALGISDRAVRKWKYRESFPRWDIAIDIIEWVKLGKPMTMQQAVRSNRQMM